MGAAWPSAAPHPAFSSAPLPQAGRYQSAIRRADLRSTCPGRSAVYSAWSAPALEASIAKPTLYVCVCSYAPTGPIERNAYLENVEDFARTFDLDLVVSPLMHKYRGRADWLEIDDRIADIREALRHDIIAPWRGGYGAIQLIETALAARRTKKTPALVGYSDVTNLHAVWQVRGWGPRFYGGFGEWLKKGRGYEALYAWMNGQTFTRDAETDPMARVVRAGEAKGPVFAACAVVLAALVGTRAFPDLRGQILALEDVDEKPYQLDTALWQMHLAGKLKGVRALLGGTFSHSHHSDYLGPSHDEIIAEWADRLKIPAVVRLPFGHQTDALGLPAGAPVTLRARSATAWSADWAPQPPV